VAESERETSGSGTIAPPKKDRAKVLPALPIGQLSNSGCKEAPAYMALFAVDRYTSTMMLIACCSARQTFCESTVPLARHSDKRTKKIKTILSADVSIHVILLSSTYPQPAKPNPKKDGTHELQYSDVVHPIGCQNAHPLRKGGSGRTVEKDADRKEDRADHHGL
jgi:hypothetical protein